MTALAEAFSHWFGEQVDKADGTDDLKRLDELTEINSDWIILQNQFDVVAREVDEGNANYERVQTALMNARKWAREKGIPVPPWPPQ